MKWEHFPASWIQMNRFLCEFSFQVFVNTFHCFMHLAAWSDEGALQRGSFIKSNFFESK